MPPRAVPTPPAIQLFNVQNRITRTQITCSLLAQYLNFVMHKTNMENEKNNVTSHHAETYTTRMWANAHRDGRPAEYRWRPLFNAAKFG